MNGAWQQIEDLRKLAKERLARIKQLEAKLVEAERNKQRLGSKVVIARTHSEDLGDKLKQVEAERDGAREVKMCCEGCKAKNSRYWMCADCWEDGA